MIYKLLGLNKFNVPRVTVMSSYSNSVSPLGEYCWRQWAAVTTCLKQNNLFPFLLYWTWGDSTCHWWEILHISLGFHFQSDWGSVKLPRGTHWPRQTLLPRLFPGRRFLFFNVKSWQQKFTWINVFFCPQIHSPVSSLSIENQVKW